MGNRRVQHADMSDPIVETDAPGDAPVERLEVSDLGPPEPLAETLERLAAIDDETVLVQYNDRTPQYLLPKLDARGYAHETVDHDDATVTVIWTDET